MSGRADLGVAPSTGADASLICGVDVGGTFTDVVRLETHTGRVAVGKVPSTTGDYSRGFLAALDRVGAAPGSIARLLHGTTAATNASIERKGARVAAVFTSGFRDTLTIGTAQRFTGGLFDPRFARPRPLVPRAACLEVRERVDHLGREVAPVDERDVDRVTAELRAIGADGVAICFLHSYASDAHERAVEARLRAALPGIFVCRSSDVHPQIREFERFTATALNAYLGPVVESYVGRLREAVRAQGYQGDLLIMSSNGGVISAAHAAAYPVRTVLSGPAGGVSAGLWLGRALGLADLITCDMGGTSTDVCLIRGGRASLTEQRVVGGLPLRLPQLDINTIGAGGGSVASLADDGTFHVGPESAGAVPGPACYGRGGERATVTDANVVLARLGHATLLGGVMRLDPAPARVAVERLRERLGLADAEVTAEGLLRIAVSNMAGAIREISVERGEDPRSAALVAFGGAGAMHGCDVAEELDMGRVIVPLHPGNFAALGLLLSDEKHELVRTYLRLLDDVDVAEMRRALVEMEAGGRRGLSSGGLARDVVVESALEARFLGQSHPLLVRVDPARLDTAEIDAAFRRLYERTWSYRPEGRVQVVNLRVTVLARATPFELRPAAEPVARTVEEAAKERRDVFVRGKWRAASVYDRERLPLGATVGGPAVIDEAGGTTVVPPGWTAEVHPTGHLFLWPR